MQNSLPLKEKLTCPVCSTKFIPEAFLFEKTSFDAVKSEGEQIKVKGKNHQLILRPYADIKGAWVTYCPDCGYIMKFIGEIGKKEIADQSLHLLKRGVFDEFGDTYKYSFEKRPKTYMDYLDYFLDKVGGIKNQIKNALDEVNFTRFGNPYQQWRNDKSIDSFKFLVHFQAILKDYCDHQIEGANNKEMDQKIKECMFPPEIEQSLLLIRDLGDKISHEVYTLNGTEEEEVEKGFLQFMYYLVGKQLKPLKLDDIKVEPDYDFIDINKINYEIKEFLRLYLYDTLQIKEFDEKFLQPLLEHLGITV